MNSLGTMQSFFNKLPIATVTSTMTLSNAVGTNISYNLNYTNNIGGTNYSYTKTGYNVYFINNTTVPSNIITSYNSGTFILTVTGGPKTLYYAISGSAAGGGGGNVAGGGASSGELIYGSVTLPIGSYNCSFTIGVGGYGCPSYVGSGAYTTNGGQNGYGYNGYNSTLTINGTTYTARRGCPGGPSQMSHGATGFVLGGGAGCNYNVGYGTLTGAVGSKFNGGTTILCNTPNMTTGGSSGASNEMAGRNATIITNPSSGMMGGDPTPSSKFPIGLQFNQTCYFCEGGHGSNSRMAVTGTIIPPTQTSYKLAGCNAGVNGSNQYITDSILGSGGSGMVYGQGTNRTTPSAGNGGNGFIFLSF